MRIYIAARAGRRDEAWAAAGLLRRDGHQVVSRWHEQQLPAPSTEEAHMDENDVRWAHTVLCLTEPVGTSNPGGGRWFEAGLARALGKRLAFVGPPEIIFCHLRDVEVYPDLDAARRALIPDRDQRIREIARSLCRAHGTAQCAAICLSHSSLHTTNGACPESASVWGRQARQVYTDGGG